MGDISAEPSMEDILSSIKRIIAEEGEAPGGRARRPIARAAPTPPAYDEPDEVLELDRPMLDDAELDDDEPEPEPAPPVTARAAPSAPPADPAPIVSRRATEASRGSLDTLSRMIVAPPAATSGQGGETLEGLVREMLRPMLKDWLDANLPDLVEGLVAKEIARISGERRS